MTVADVLAAHVAGEQRLVFLDVGGDPVSRNPFNGTWPGALERADVDQRLRLHDLRHAYASALIHAGESVKVVQARMGHLGRGHPRRLRAPLARLGRPHEGPPSTPASAVLRTPCGLVTHRRR
jgi:integrase